jgi:hypothetical protein
MNGILGISREADRQAMERDAMNMRGGMLREDPGLMQRIGSTVADYAVPDRYGKAFNPSVMSPKLDLRNAPPVADTDMTFGAEQVMDMMPGAGIGGVIKRVRGNVGDAVKALPLKGGKYIGAPHDLKVTPQKMPWVMGRMEQMAKEGELAWPWYESGGQAFNNWFQPTQRRQAIDTYAGMSPQAPVELNTKFGTKAMNQFGLGQDVNAGMVPSQARGMLSPLWSGEKNDLWQTVKNASKVPSFSVNLRHGAGFPLSQEDMLRSTQDRWMLRAGNFKGAMSPNSYNYLSAITQDVAGTLGIRPHEAQAGVWTSLKARWESVAPAIQKKYVKKGMMRKSMKVNDKTGQRERIGPYEIKPEHARQYNDEVFNKAMKADIPDDAFDEAGRSFDYFFDKISKNYDSHSMDELKPFMNEHGRVAPWDAQGIPHRVQEGKVDLLLPEFEGIVDPASQKQAQIAEAMIRQLRGESGDWGAKVNQLGGGEGLERFNSGKTILSPY